MFQVPMPGEQEPHNTALVEADLLRRTLWNLLVENEALRTALQVQKPVAQATDSELNPDSVTRLPMAVPSKFTAEDRRKAVERYRQKRKRRLQQPSLNGPRYVKMKAVADGKKRSACGKFVKKSELHQQSNLALVEDPEMAPTVLTITA